MAEVTPPPDVASFRTVMARYTTGVVVATACLDGFDHAMTANSFTSVSLDPMLALVCVERGSRFHDAVAAAGAWAVSILGEGDAALARWLATPGRPLAGQLDAVAVRRGVTGAPLLVDAVASLELTTVAVHPAGDHDIVVGRVVALGAVNDVAPLLYGARRFGGFTPATV